MILLLGATGLLGQNLLKLFLEQGRRVKCIVREGSSIDASIVKTAAPGQLTVVNGSILDKPFILKQMWGCGRIVSFGDAVNDLPMFEISDACYAVANAVEAVKAAATGVIGSNEDDGVARWLAQNAGSIGWNPENDGKGET